MTTSFIPCDNCFMYVYVWYIVFVCMCVYACVISCYSCFQTTPWNKTKRSLDTLHIRGVKYIFISRWQVCVKYVWLLLVPHYQFIYSRFFASDLRLSLAIFPDVLQTAATDESELALEMKLLCQLFYRHKLLFAPHVTLSAVSYMSS